jgi:hypothetical protein
MSAEQNPSEQNPSEENPVEVIVTVRAEGRLVTA